MNRRISTCLLFAFLSSIASLPLKEKDNSYVTQPPPAGGDFDKDVVFAVIRGVNQGYNDSEDIIIQNDILLSKSRRLATNCRSCLWPASADGIIRVPYVFNVTAYNDANLALFRSAMEEYDTLTCIRFSQRTKEKDYISITGGKGCASYIGRLGGGQQMWLSASGCMHRGIIQHELQHSLGFFHEVTRKDRDNYITIRREFLDAGSSAIFNIADANTLDLPYDYSSIMHYDRYVGTINSSQPTIVTHPDPNVPVGQRFGLSVLDVQKINKLYKCNVCSTLLNEENGEFSSTNFPSSYPKNMNCSWLIRVPSGQVSLKFDFFDIQDTSECVADYIRIYDGPSRNYPFLLDRTCGTFPYPAIISSTDQMLIEFISDGSVPSAGFRASYTSVETGTEV